MEYPIIISGERRGSLRREQQGLYTVFEAQLDSAPEGLCRLWLHGGGESAYLGIVQPWSGGGYLRRKLSRSEMAAFPRCIEYAGDSEGGLHSEAGEKREQAPEPERGEEGLLWFRRPDGSLVSFDGRQRLVALPVQSAGLMDGCTLRSIEGRDYMIFKY